MTTLEPVRFIGEAVEAEFDKPPLLEKKPGCPDGIRWRGETLRVVEKPAEWVDNTRRGRAARNMRPSHANRAQQQGSWGVGRTYFRVRTEDGRQFELYYDRSPKGADARKGQWFLVSELAAVEPRAPDEPKQTPIRLAVFDLDNTLVGLDMVLRPRVRAAVAKALERGVQVTIATGRGPGPTERFARELGITAPLICFQGGLVYDYVARRVLHETRLDPAAIPIVVRLAEAHGWNLQFETPTMVYLPLESDHPADLLEGLMSVSPWQRVRLPEGLPETPHKFILAVHDPAERDALAAELGQKLAAAGLNLNVVPSHPILVEGTPPGLNKGTGLAWLADYMRVPREAVMAVGDNDNDAPMLAWAGVGVAVANASPAARAAADWIAPAVDDDGAAVALERYALT
jgi:Cof subfamily protein (haloacid dehalogenase superfamily)